MYIQGLDGSSFGHDHVPDLLFHCKQQLPGEPSNVTLQSNFKKIEISGPILTVPIFNFMDALKF